MSDPITTQNYTSALESYYQNQEAKRRYARLECDLMAAQYGISPDALWLDWLDEAIAADQAARYDRSSGVAQRSTAADHLYSKAYALWGQRKTAEARAKWEAEGEQRP